MADQWHYARQGQQFGPVSGEQLRQLAASGQLQPGDMVWKQGMAAWSPASSVQGLFAAPAQPVTPSSAPAPAPGAGSEPVPVSPAPSHAPWPGGPGRPGAGFPIDWTRFDAGAWVILASAGVAILSMLVKWVDFGLTYRIGLVQSSVMFIGVFIYPVWMVVTNAPIHRIGGILCGAWGALAVLLYITEHTARVSSLFGEFGSAASFGVYMFLLAAIGLIVGVVLYRPGGSRPIA